MSTFEAFCQALLRGGTEYQMALNANQAIVATTIANQFNSPKKSKIISSSWSGPIGDQSTGPTVDGQVPLLRDRSPGSPTPT